MTDDPGLGDKLFAGAFLVCVIVAAVGLINFIRIGLRNNGLMVGWAETVAIIVGLFVGVYLIGSGAFWLDERVEAWRE